MLAFQSLKKLGADLIQSHSVNLQEKIRESNCNEWTTECENRQLWYILPNFMPTPDNFDL
jgi:hypothetical protein